MTIGETSIIPSMTNVRVDAACVGCQKASPAKTANANAIQLLGFAVLDFRTAAMSLMDFSRTLELLCRVKHCYGLEKRIIWMVPMRKNDSLSDPAKLDSELLRTFLAIAGSGSFSRGAERIFRSQSAASLQMKKLEAVLGQPVFERHARGVVLTSTGERLQPVAQRVIDMIDTVVGELRSDGLQGHIRMGVPDEHGETVLPKAIARFTRDHPQVELSVRCSLSAEFPTALARGELDLAVHAAQAVPSGARILRREKTLWVGSRFHPVHERDPLPVALFDRACWWREEAIKALEGRRHRLIYTTESVAGMTAAIEAGAAVGLLGESSIRPSMRILSQADGFAELPPSIWVLEPGPGAGSEARTAMMRAITDAFANDDA
jgi:DNA-binding transcriptional LysR family regulator